jgi:hypothetical protein
VIVGAFVEHAAPEHAAGAEWTLHDLMTWLATRGHDCRVVARKGGIRERGADGVLVYSNASDDEAVRHFQECDVMLTQLEGSREAQLLAYTYQTPLVQLVHSESQLVELGVKDSCRALVVFNAQHVADACQWWPGASMVMHPPVNYDRVRAAQIGVCATLVNTSHNKGGPTLYFLARELEQRPFMGVTGAYEEQIVGPDGMAGTESNPTPTGLPANLRVFYSMPIHQVFSYTRILLLLSKHETYGRVAAEAIVSGIPVVATRTPGALESVGQAAKYIDNRDDLRGVARTVDSMYGDAAWQGWSKLALDRAASNLARQRLQLHRLHRALLQIADDNPEMTL